VAPAEELADGKKAFASPGRRDNQEIAKLRTGVLGADPDHVVHVPDTKKEGRVVIRGRSIKRKHFGKLGKACVMQFVLPREEG
jgi:hypothetical protein